MEKGKKAKEIQVQQRQEELKNAGRYLIGLIRCSFHGEVPKEKPEKCSWELVFRLAKSNSVESTASPEIRAGDSGGNREGMEGSAESDDLSSASI